MWDTFYYGCCYYPEHWDEKRHASDIARMARCGFNVVRLGEGAWAYWEPDEGRFQFDMFDRVIDLCRKHGLKVIMGTPTYCAPAWVASKYPEVLRWNYQRIPMAHGSRRNFNYTSPKYYELSDRLVTALAEHYAGEKQIIAWQLDNEFNCHMDVSYAPSDTIAFRKWLKEKYKTLARLNDAWGTRFWSQTYSDWDQIDLPHPTPTYPNPTHLLDETRFISDCVVRFARRQAEILRTHNPRWLITHNGLFANINGPDLVGVLDFFGHDQYPLFSQNPQDTASALVQARSLGFPYGILEQQSGPGGQVVYLQRTPRPGEMRLWAWQSIMHGAKLLSYFRWRTCPYGAEQHWHGLLDQDDRDNRRIAEARKIGREIAAVPKAFFDAPVVRAAAVLRDFDNEANDRRINIYTQEGSREQLAWCAELLRQHVPVDMAWPTSDLKGYRLLIAPHLKIVTRELAKKLTRFVESGGTLVLGGESGLKDINCHIVEMPLPGPWRKLAGVEVEDWTTVPLGQTYTARLENGTAINMSTFVERLKPIDAEVIGRWISDDPLLHGAAAITRNRIGKGTVYYIGGYLSQPAISAMLSYLANGPKLRPLAQASGDVNILCRSAGKRKWFCLTNHTATQQRITGLPPGQVVMGDATASGDDWVLPGFGVAIIQSKCQVARTR